MPLTLRPVRLRSMLSGDIMHMVLGLRLGSPMGVVGQAREAASRAKWQTVVVPPGTM